MHTIVGLSKDVEAGVIRYRVTTDDGDQYQVIHLVRRGMILERIYVMGGALPACILRREYPAHHMPILNFKEIIEGGGRSS